jgi:CRP-like cAMP-binding protein
MKLPEIFASPANVRTILQGTAIFNIGDESGEMYVVQSGEVDILLNGDIVETVGPDGPHRLQAPPREPPSLPLPG